MKHFKLLTFLLLLTLAGSAQVAGSGQDCATFENATYFSTQGSPDCKAVARVQATGASADKFIRIRIYPTSTLSGTTLLDACITILGGSLSKGYFSDPFFYTCGTTPYYLIETTTGNACGGSVCNTYTGTGPVGATFPIKLSSFYGNRKSNGVQLEWTSAQESNASYYGIERNTGAGFTAIDKVNATNSVFGSKYSFEDPISSKTVVQYRLRLVDKDGSFTLSNVIAIKGVSSVSDVAIYPNPAVVGNAKIKISDITDITTVQVYDLSGKIIKNINVTSNDINMSDLQAGSYLLKMINAKTGGAAAKRFIILN